MSERKRRRGRASEQERERQRERERERGSEQREESCRSQPTPRTLRSSKQKRSAFPKVLVAVEARFLKLLTGRHHRHLPRRHRHHRRHLTESAQHSVCGCSSPLTCRRALMTCNFATYLCRVLGPGNYINRVFIIGQASRQDF